MQNLTKNFSLASVVFIILAPLFSMAQGNEDQSSTYQSSSDKDRTTTISDYEYIRSEISKLSEFALEFDEIMDLFSSNPSYSTKCYTNTELKKSSYVRIEDRVFGPFFPDVIEGEIKFQLQKMDLGFNLFQTTHMNFLTDPYEQLVTCSRSNGGCKSFSKSKRDEAFPYLPESEEYIPELAVKSEDWTTYIAEDKKTLFSEISVSAETKERGLIMDEGSTFYFSKNYLCVSTQIKSKKKKK